MSKALVPKDFAQELRRRATLLERELVKAEAENLKQAEGAAKLASSGGYSSARLAAMGHPYATRDPRPPGDPGIINNQKGVFLRSWQRDAPRLEGNRIVSRLRNTAPQAGYLDKGTRRMIARPIRQVIYRSVRQARVQRLRGVLIRVLGARPK